MNHTILAALAILAAMPLHGQDGTPDPAVERVVHETYRAFSFQAGERPDIDLIRSHFTPTAQIAFTRGDSLVSSSIDEYLARWSGGVASLDSLDEWEIWGRTDQFGNVAQRISAYAVQVNDAESERGVILFQFVRVDGRWLIQSMSWQSENESLTLPAEFLGDH